MKKPLLLFLSLTLVLTQYKNVKHINDLIQEQTNMINIWLIKKNFIFINIVTVFQVLKK